MPTAKKKKADDGTPKKTRKTKPKPANVTNAPAAAELATSAADAGLGALEGHVKEAGGAVLGAWRDPLGGKPLLLASLPIDKVAPTPFQRDASPAHVKKLVHAIGKTGWYLDPIIVM